MKLRIQGDSLRLRLTQTDVRTLTETGAVTDAMQVAPGAALRYSLRAADAEVSDPAAGGALAATLDGGALTVLIPRSWVAPWMESDTVGFEGTVPAGDGRTLAILIEKDFACLDESRDEADAFPNPHATAC